MPTRHVDRCVAPLGALAMAVLLLVAGCASGPTPAGRSSGMYPGGERQSVPSRNPDRDGPPSDAPPNLASLPDPVPQVEPIKPGGPNKPYVVQGQSYEPAVSDIKWTERGQASWYGTKFHGRRTASGEMFSMYGLTAAHRTLPIPSYARVRNVSNGKEVIVRVNDRGPFHSSRVMDLSYAAAVKLGITGTGQVEISRLTFDDIRTGAWQRNTVTDPAPALAQGADDPIMAAVGRPVSPGEAMQVADLGVSLPQAAGEKPLVSAALPAVALKEGASRAFTPDAKGFWVQLAALGRREGVDRLQQRVATDVASLSPLLAVFHEPPYFKLQVGPYGSRDEAMAVAQQARDTLQLTPMVLERR